MLSSLFPLNCLSEVIDILTTPCGTPDSPGFCDSFSSYGLRFLSTSFQSSSFFFFLVFYSLELARLPQ